MLEYVRADEEYSGECQSVQNCQRKTIESVGVSENFGRVP